MVNYRSVVAPTLSRGRKLSSGATSGENQMTYSRFSDISQAISVINLWIRGQGKMEKVGGCEKIYATPFTGTAQALKLFRGHLVFVVANKLYSYYLATNTLTTHKTYPAGSTFSIDADKGGEFVYIANGLGQIDYLTFQLGTELSGYAYTFQTFGTGPGGVFNISGYVNQAATGIYLFPGTDTFNNIKASQTVTLTNGKRYLMAWILLNNVDATVSNFSKISGCFSDIVVYDTSGISGNIVYQRVECIDQTKTLDVTLNQHQINTPNHVAQTPSGTINGVNRVFKLSGSQSITDVSEVKVDGAAVLTALTFDASIDRSNYTFTVPVAPVATIKVTYKTILNPLQFSVNSLKEIKEDTLVLSTLTNSPCTSVVSLRNQRLFAGNIAGIGGQIQYSKTDNGISLTPFTNWTDATTMDGAGQLNSNKIGEVKSIVAIGTQTIVLGSHGRLAFTITSEAVGTVPYKVNHIDFEESDFGGEIGAINTIIGVVYTNEMGVYAQAVPMLSNVPGSSTSEKLSDALGDITDYDLTNVSIFYYPERNSLCIACKQGTKSLIKVYNTQFKAWSTIEYDGEIQAITFDPDSNKAYALIDGYLSEFLTGTTDFGNDLYMEFSQEVNLGDLTGRYRLVKQDYAGELNGSFIKVAYDIYREDGTYVPTILVQSWQDDRSGGTGRISSFERLIVKLTELSDKPIIISFLMWEFDLFGKSRNRKLANLNLLDEAGGNEILDETDGNNITTS